MTQMNLTMKQTQTNGHREQTCGCQGVGLEEEWVGIWGQHVQAVVCTMDKQQGPTL